MTLVNRLKYILPATGTIGIYRGLNSYKNDYKIQCKEYELYDKHSCYGKNKPEYLYSECFMYSFTGLLFYTIPLLIPIVLSKELYRLEVNIRGLDEEKKSEYYDKLY